MMALVGAPYFVWLLRPHLIQEVPDERADQLGTLSDEVVRGPRHDAQLRAGDGRGDEQAVAGRVRASSSGLRCGSLVQRRTSLARTTSTCSGPSGDRRS